MSNLKTPINDREMPCNTKTHEAQPHPYADIINLPHPVSLHHPPIPLSARAAQFGSFAALNGHEEAIRNIADIHASIVDSANDGPEFDSI